MKKILVSILVAVMAIVLSTSLVLAESQQPFTMSAYSEMPDTFTIDIEGENAFIETTLATSALAFTHRYESENLYSSLRSNILVTDCNSEDCQPCLYTWINYAADAPLNLHTAVFELDGKTYTLTGVGDPERIIESEQGYLERLIVIYGSDNWDFFSTIASEAIGYFMNRLGSETGEDVAVPAMKMTLYGDETIEADVPEGFWMDMAALVIPMYSGDSLWMLLNIDGTPCEVSGGE